MFYLEGLNIGLEVVREIMYEVGAWIQLALDKMRF